MKTMTKPTQLYMTEQEVAAAEEKAARAGETLSEYMRRKALKMPEIPVRIRIAGASGLEPAMDALEQALGGEGAGGGCVPELAAALHGRIMALKAERTADPWTGAVPGILQRGRVDRAGLKLVAFRMAPAEYDAVRQAAAACGLKVSAYFRMRAAGRFLKPAPQPAEGMHAVRRAVKLLGMAAEAAGDGELERLHREADEHRWTLEEAEA